MIAATALLRVAIAASFISFKQDKRKTKESLVGGMNIAKGTVPEIMGIMALVSLVLAFLPTETVRKVLGGDSEVLSAIYGALIGTVTIIPAFITTLTMVGFATLPLEIEHFGKKFALTRNALSLIAALGITLGMGVSI